MKIKAADLRKALSAIADAIPARSIALAGPTTTIQGKDSSFNVTASNITAFGSMNGPCEGGLAPVSVPCRLLGQIAQDSQDSVVELEMDGAQLRFTYGQNRLNTSVLPVEQLPIELDGPQVAVNLSDLAEAIDSVGFACSPSKEMEIRSEAIHIKLTDKMITCSASDKKLCASFQQPAIASLMECMFHYSKAGGLTYAMAQKGARLTLNGSYLACHHDNGVFAVKLIEGEFWPVAALFAQEGAFLGRLAVTPLQDTLGVIQTLVIENFAPVLLDFKADSLEVAFKGQNNSFEASLVGKFKPGRVTVDAFRLRRLLQGIGSGSDGDVNASTLPNGALMLQTGNLFTCTTTLSDRKPEPQ